MDTFNNISYQRLTLAHSFKDKSNQLKDVNVGLFTYPMLMAADILLYDANVVQLEKTSYSIWKLQEMLLLSLIINMVKH